MSNKDNEPCFIIKAEPFFYAARAIRNVALGDDLNRVLLRMLGNAIVFSCVGKGLFLSYAVPATVNKDASLVLDCKELLLSSIGMRINKEKHKSEDIAFYFKKRRGGNVLVMKFYSVYDNSIRVLQTKTLSVRSLDVAPTIPSMPKDRRYKVSSEAILDVIGGAHTAASQKDTNPAFCGCKFRIDNEGLFAAALDGVCLSERLHSSGCEATIDCVLPYSYCSKMNKFFSADVGDLEVSLSNGVFFVKSSSCLFGAATISTSFPDYSSIISAKKPYRFVINRSILYDCFNSLIPVAAKDSNNKVMISFDIVNGSASVRSSGFSSSGIPVEVVASKRADGELVVGFDLHYLLKIFRPLTTDKVEFLISSSEAPVIIKPVENEENEIRSLTAIAPLM